MVRRELPLHRGEYAVLGGVATMELHSCGGTVWVRADPRQWPHAVQDLLQKANGHESPCPSETLRTLTRKNEADIKRNLQTYLRDSQEAWTEIVPAICQLVHLAPDIGSLFLDMSFKSVDQANLWLSLAGKIKSKPMRCRYVEKRNVETTTNETRNEGPGMDDPNVFEVTEYHCMFPNILNINMIQALAKTEALDIFAKKSIQAIVRSTWHEQVMSVTKIKLFLGLLEVAVLLHWGLTTKNGLPFDRILWTQKKDANDFIWLGNYDLPPFNQTAVWDGVKARNGDCFAPIKWNILAALNLEQLLEFMMMWYNVRQCRKNADASYDPSSTDCAKDLWRDGSTSWRWPVWLNSTSIHWLMRTLLLTSTFVPLNEDNLMVYSQQVMLSLTYCASMVGMFTLFMCFASEFGLSLVSMRRTILDPAVLHFFLVLSLLFLIVMMAWLILDRENTLLAALQFGWEAFFLSDDKAMEDISAVQDKTDSHMFASLAHGGTFVALFFFSVFLTNLLIAIFSDAYSKARKKEWVSFFHRRAIIARNCIMARPAKIPHRLQQLKEHAWAIAAPLLALGAFMQLGVGVYGNSHKHKIGWAFSLVSIFAWALMVFLLKAASFKFIEGQNSWFSTEPNEKRVLMVWCRKDFNEKVWLSSDEMTDVKADLRKILESLNTLSEQPPTTITP